MPIYNYECQGCGNIIELIGTYEDETKYLVCRGGCSELVSSVYKRVFSPSKNFSLKGRCWAKDGYSKEHKKDRK